MHALPRSASIVFAAIATTAGAQPSFTGLGTFETPNGTARPIVSGISPDGRTLVGRLWLQSGPEPGFIWTQAQGVQSMGSVLESVVNPSDVTNDGTVVGYAYTPGPGPNRGFRWSAQSGVTELHPVSGGTAAAVKAISADGSWVAGGTYTQGQGYRVTRWPAGGQAQDLGVIPGHSQTYVWDMSNDGSTIVGWSNGPFIPAQSYRWTQQTGFEILPLIPGWSGGNALGTNDDGLAIVGACSGGIGLSRAYLWTSTAGTLDLGTLPGHTDSSASGVSADGRMVLGTSYGPLGANRKAFLWREGIGMVVLRDYLLQLGLNLDGWDLPYAGAISDDGTILAGLGMHNGQNESWVAVIPAPGTLVLAAAAALFATGRRRT
jgi:hypothetical protein